MAAVMGAAIGALGGLGGGWLALLGQGRQQQKQRETERERWRDELRRDAYSACIASTKQLSAAWWKFADRVRKDGSDEEEWRVGFAEAHDAWVRFSEAVAAVSVAGPRTVVEAADTLRGAMYDLEVVGMDWFGAALREGHEHLGGWEQRFKQAAEAKREPDRAFQKAAREALGTERP
ncbi:hypothetical protein ACFWA5_02080 [Streptomyces mirabilis]|uniref:hypothetical protein n=1 Tax=Streptomyces mirabilis TaxID=68239 RepID=UPI00364956AB